MMFTNYIKIAFRNIWKYKIQSLTSILGLGFGIACFVPALYWMCYETSYDSFYPEASHIYRIYAVEKQSGKVNKGVSRIVEKKLREQFPTVDASVAFMSGQENCRTEKVPLVQLHLLYADSSFFSVFPQEVVSGNAKQPLQIMNNMVLSETMAVRLFGDVEKAIGKQIQNTINTSLPPYTVTAVVKDPPSNTNLSFDAIVFHDMLRFFSELPEEEQWNTFFMELYVKFNPYTDVDEVAERLCDFTSRLVTNTDIELRMMPISDVRHKLNSDVPFTLNFVGLFVVSGILLLFTAVFNFMNLHFDLFLQRIRELRMRVVHGATGGQLICQMLFELTCSIFLSLFAACSFIVIVSPAFCGLLEINIEISQMILLFTLCGIGVSTLILFSGFILLGWLSRLAMCTESGRKIVKKPVVRHMAIIFQLIISMIFIVAASVVMMQMNFVNHKDLGFDCQGIIQLSGFTDYSGKVQEALVQELIAIPQVESVTDACFEPQHKANSNTTITNVEWPGKPQDKKPAFNCLLTDSRFAETFKLKMLEGKWWDESQRQKIVLNKEAVRIMELSEAVGSIIQMPSPDDGSVSKYEVVGVVNDFHYLSLRSRIQPTIFVSSAYSDNILYIRVMPGQELAVVRQITTILPNIDTSLAEVRLTPMGELYDRLNRSEQVGLKLFSILAIVCLLISLFGIYAVASSSSRRRRREIAVRKVVGAVVGDIILMFFREYTMHVILAGAMALPIAYLIMNNWLQGYAYRTTIPWWLLLGVVIGVIVVVLLTIFGQILKAANSNPAEVVKSE